MSNSLFGPSKTIVVKWDKEEESVDGMEMSVVVSNHPRFVAGSRFDFGFFTIATKEGYTIISHPIDV